MNQCATVHAALAITDCMQGGSSDAVLAAGVAAAKAGAPAGASVTLWQQPEASKSQPNH
jgi:hypothetical protein